ncbi:unnamed protein product [Owenia fusiformis]|uniref:Ribonuclease 3 n=1 Tax=Owenia fusiformis TaxID=6347 RepID=A0A8J1UHC7_OWEFU|nr:unnamed protein product [Owenia fusiformis]
MAFRGSSRPNDNGSNAQQQNYTQDGRLNDATRGAWQQTPPPAPKIHVPPPPFGPYVGETPLFPTLPPGPPPGIPPGPPPGLPPGGQFNIPPPGPSSDMSQPPAFSFMQGPPLAPPPPLNAPFGDVDMRVPPNTQTQPQQQNPGVSGSHYDKFDNRSRSKWDRETDRDNSSGRGHWRSVQSSRSPRSMSRERSFDSGISVASNRYDSSATRSRTDHNSRSRQRDNIRSSGRSNERSNNRYRSRSRDRSRESSYRGSVGSRPNNSRSGDNDRRDNDRRDNERRDNDRRDDRRDNDRRDYSRDRKPGRMDGSPRRPHERIEKGPERTNSPLSRYDRRKNQPKSEAKKLLEEKKLLEQKRAAEMEKPKEKKKEMPVWVRCAPADLYFQRDEQTGSMGTTQKMKDLQKKFEEDLLLRAKKIRASKPKPDPSTCTTNLISLMHTHSADPENPAEGGESSSDDDDDDDVLGKCHFEYMRKELERKLNDPDRLHEDLWFNEPGQQNDGPWCRCSAEQKEFGIRHNIYPGEKRAPKCNPDSNNARSLYNYHITMTPETNFKARTPSTISHDGHSYIFEGFSLLSHAPIGQIPKCSVLRYNIDYTILWKQEPVPENFNIKSADMVTDFIYKELLEFIDLDCFEELDDETCRIFHLVPRFIRELPENGKELLSIDAVLKYFLDNNKPLLEKSELHLLAKLEKHEWQEFVDEVQGMLVTVPGMRPGAFRVDQIDRPVVEDNEPKYPMLVHFGMRPHQLTYAGDQNFQKLFKKYLKLKHLLANKPKVSIVDKEALWGKEDELSDLKSKSNMKKEITTELSSEGCMRTGIRSDICQHAIFMPVLISHLRFHNCLNNLEDILEYKFKDRYKLQLALTHPSHKVNFGTTSDHGRNTLSNCGIRSPNYGTGVATKLKTHRKRGINVLFEIMSQMGNEQPTLSDISHNERYEHLGDAVLECIVTVHLYFMFPHLDEGALATFRSAIVQNQHLTVLAKNLQLEKYLLYSHGAELCHDLHLNHALADCFEAMLCALYLDGGIHVAQKVMAKCLFGREEDAHLHDIWTNPRPDPLQDDEPDGDRHWISSSPVLQNLTELEEVTGLQFKWIRLLARSLSPKYVGYNNLTLGHNERMEFLGDSILQFIASLYLFNHFPNHHEGHLSLLRSSLVNNRTQSIVCDELDLTKYRINPTADIACRNKKSISYKEKADLLEAFIAAMFIDQGLDTVVAFCKVCFFPRLKHFILTQDWNDPKSHLQQCCLTLRELDKGEPDIPTYRIIESHGATNSRRYTVAVYFRGERLASGTGHSIQQGEMHAAMNALTDKEYMFPHLKYQRSFVKNRRKLAALDPTDKKDIWQNSIWETGLPKDDPTKNRRKYKPQIPKRYKK